MIDKATFVKAYQAKARENLREAKSCLAAGLQRATISRAYYALYQAANAWIGLQGAQMQFDPDRPNLSHEQVEDRWEQILADIANDFGIESDFDGHKIYGRLKSLRVRVDYKCRIDPTMEEATKAVDGAERAAGWLLAALKKAGR